ncbi:MAG TPA: ABC-F family ATP-binding cassette domain-containing protein [Ktedonobacteraceae bacterium]|nr:ABC-F family ATP-binding cassette domain-containing protein [Ktedonobacteraceae bacterium]
MLLTVRNLSKSYGAINVLDDVSFVVNAHERSGIIGPNGVGKSTLLRILTGYEEADTGHVAFGPASEPGYLPQTTPEFYGQSIQDLILQALGNVRRLEERMHQLETAMGQASEEQLADLLAEYNNVSIRFQDLGGYDLDHKIATVMAGLHIDYLDREQEMSRLSGGEKARIGLAILLLRAPDILLLDEPTNHLDFASIAWLETYLASYTGAVVLVSHDRQFLNRAINRIFEIDEYDHKLKIYEGNYDAYVQAKAQERIKWEEDYQRQQEEIVALRERIKAAKRAVLRTQSRPARDNDKFARHFFEQNVQSSSTSKIHQAEVLLERIEADPIPKPPEILRVSSQFHGDPMQSQEVIRLEQISKRFDERTLFEHIDLTIGPRARMMLVGENGAGKTTLFRLIMGQEQADSGTIHITEGARVGYLPQDPFFADLDTSVIDAYRYGQVGYESEFVGRLIGYGLFRLDDMHKKVRQLSMGQRRKLEIARLLAARPNMLLLDEPTNYISLDVLEAFESALQMFPGPVIAISHDRWFIQRFGGEVWVLQQARLSKQEHENVKNA